MWDGKLFLQGVPDQNIAEKIEQKLKNIPEFKRFHHLHLWSLDGEHHVLTAHLALQEALSTQQQLELKKSIAVRLSKFNLEHTTIELEMTNEQCRDDSQALAPSVRLVGEALKRCHPGRCVPAAQPLR